MERTGHPSVVDNIDGKQIEEEGKRNTFFYQWRQMKGSDATYTSSPEDLAATLLAERIRSSEVKFERI